MIYLRPIVVFPYDWPSCKPRQAKIQKKSEHIRSRRNQNRQPLDAMNFKSDDWTFAQEALVSPLFLRGHERGELVLSSVLIQLFSDIVYAEHGGRIHHRSGIVGQDTRPCPCSHLAVA